MQKPKEKMAEVYAIDGMDLCRYISDIFPDNQVTGDDVYEVIREQIFMNPDEDLEGLFELIIEEEDWCYHQDSLKGKVLFEIAEEFGGHFNVNFLSATAYF